MEVEPEYASVEAFATYLLDDDRTSFSLSDVVRLAEILQRSNHGIILELKSYGFSMTERKPEKKVRGFTTNNHDRWYGPGASKTYGGSGWEQITGLAGQEG